MVNGDGSMERLGVAVRWEGGVIGDRGSIMADRGKGVMRAVGVVNSVSEGCSGLVDDA